MDAVNFIKEKNRMCKEHKSICHECEFSKLGIKCAMNCWHYSKKATEAVAIVKQWSKEHPQKTILMDLLEKHPKVALNDETGFPVICPYHLGYEDEDYCRTSAECDCASCWNRPLQENGE